MRTMLTCVSVAILAAACAPMGGETVSDRPMAMPMSATPTDAMGYVAMAGSSDMYEIESSRLALQRAQAPAVRQFAQMMIDHHTLTTQQVMQAARSAGMSPPPPMLLPPQRTMIDKLQTASGATFDRTYLQQQRVAHRMALELHRTYSQRGDTPSLRATAATAVPVVQGHIDQLKMLRAS